MPPEHLSLTYKKPRPGGVFLLTLSVLCVEKGGGAFQARSAAQGHLWLRTAIVLDTFLSPRKETFARSEFGQLQAGPLGFGGANELSYRLQQFG